MLAAIIVIVVLLILALAGIGKLCMELEELNRRTQEYNEMMDEFERLENEEDRHLDM